MAEQRSGAQDQLDSVNFLADLFHEDMLGSRHQQSITTSAATSFGQSIGMGVSTHLSSIDNNIDSENDLDSAVNSTGLTFNENESQDGS